MSEIKLAVRTFRMGTDKESAIKVLEEASEVRAAWQETDGCGSSEQCRKCLLEDGVTCFGYIEFADELADVIQAACNLADRYGIDLLAAMGRCEERNVKRGRYDD